VVASDLIIGHSFVLTGILILVEALSKDLPKGIEILVFETIILVRLDVGGTFILGHIFQGPVVHDDRAV
jgi:hypothetical protein